MVYVVSFRYYNTYNTMHFRTFSQYVNWNEVMKKNFKEFFEIVTINWYDE